MTFLTLRNPQAQRFSLLGRFEWTFHEGPSKPGFNNGDESISNLQEVKDLGAAVEQVRKAMTNSGFDDWSVELHQAVGKRQQSE